MCRSVQILDGMIPLVIIMAVWILIRGHTTTEREDEMNKGGEGAGGGGSKGRREKAFHKSQPRNLVPPSMRDTDRTGEVSPLPSAGNQESST